MPLPAPLTHQPPLWLWLLLGAIDLAIRLIALGIVPKRRRASTSTAWLLLIFLWPVVGVPLYLFFGSWWAMGKALRSDPAAHQLVKGILRGSKGGESGPVNDGMDERTASLMRLNQKQTSFPPSYGRVLQLLGDTDQAFEAMAREVDQATHHVNVLYFQTSWDHSTDPLYKSLVRACARGVKVRLLIDHHGLRTIPGWRGFTRMLDESGIEWHLMLPMSIFKGHIRRPDLRNHRKLLIIDGQKAFIGSHNLVAADYDTPAYQKAGIEYHDTSVEVSGVVVRQVQAVFASDWYYATNQELSFEELNLSEDGEANENIMGQPMQIIPSGPSYPSEPNLRMFISMVSQARHHVSIASPYFIPDEPLLAALAGAAMSGVRVDLYVSEQFDQFLVGHAQRAYYEPLLVSGVNIHLYAPPHMLHSKYVVIDGELAAIGSSNMDYRSFGLNYEVMLLAQDRHLVQLLEGNNRRIEASSRLLSLEEWNTLPWYKHYIDNICRLGSALL
ncbi:phospholipase D-like domain-containing protein [Actinomyces sp. oral taxon 181]|uniref:phospholipase D-like domain-containing protein n=1 Tax=Actinomyces sp. oral taxon 181 TaxID=712121 RepID=UPI0002A1C278|nr:phospholipase D-like domain-containing protein [Actinomyces sp. oral taxon 181]EKY15832.1 phospholipase D domain protein [Actinomyces sp. oral taxon 181 str. F0379]